MAYELELDILRRTTVMLTAEIERNVNSMIMEVKHEIAKSDKKLDKQVIEVTPPFGVVKLCKVSKACDQDQLSVQDDLKWCTFIMRLQHDTQGQIFTKVCLNF
jgi:hypothetical protein